MRGVGGVVSEEKEEMANAVSSFCFEGWGERNDEE